MANKEISTSTDDLLRAVRLLRREMRIAALLMISVLGGMLIALLTRTF